MSALGTGVLLCLMAMVCFIAAGAVNGLWLAGLVIGAAGATLTLRNLDGGADDDRC